MKSIAFALAALVAATSAQAADPGYCHHYADLAVFQFNKNLSIPGCFHGADLRWNTNWDGHYSWCLSTDYDAARSEDDYRGMRLHQCNMAAYGRW